MENTQIGKETQTTQSTLTPTVPTPPNPKISSKFDKPPHRKSPIQEGNINSNKINDPDKPNTNIEGTQTTASIDPKMHPVKTSDNANKNVDQSPSKVSFAAMVQSKLIALKNTKSTVEVRHGTHLGKPAVFFSAQDYFVNLAEDCKMTLTGNFYRGKPPL